LIKLKSPTRLRDEAFILSTLIAAFRWGLLAGWVTAIGGVISLATFFYSPFYLYSTVDRSRFLGGLAPIREPSRRRARASTMAWPSKFGCRCRMMLDLGKTTGIAH
jgi:hypothetical protein